MVKSIVFFDTEVGVDDKKIHDIGAVRTDKGIFHSASVQDFCAFVSGTEYICGHNIIHHDIKYLGEACANSIPQKTIDTLFLSPLLFPKRPYHRLLKDDKLQVEELNNPVNDSQKAKDLFFDEVNAFYNLSPEKKKIFCGLLYHFVEFQGFFDYVDFKPYKYNMKQMILDEYKDKICANADIDLLVKFYPKELAYALALVGCADQYSITPPWLIHSFPKIENVIKYLCNTPCKDNCGYCK